MWLVGGSAAVLTHSSCSHADLAAPPFSCVAGETPPARWAAGRAVQTQPWGKEGCRWTRAGPSSFLLLSQGSAGLPGPLGAPHPALRKATWLCR